MTNLDERFLCAVPSEIIDAAEKVRRWMDEQNRGTGWQLAGVCSRYVAHVAAARLKWMADNHAAIEQMVIAAPGGDHPLWYIAERFARRGYRAPAHASSPRRVYGESEVSIEAAIDNAMQRQADGKEPYYA